LSRVERVETCYTVKITQSKKIECYE
jgi:hypothetical protein